MKKRHISFLTMNSFCHVCRSRSEERTLGGLTVDRGHLTQIGTFLINQMTESERQSRSKSPLPSDLWFYLCATQYGCWRSASHTTRRPTFAIMCFTCLELRQIAQHMSTWLGGLFQLSPHAKLLRHDQADHPFASARQQLLKLIRS